MSTITIRKFIETLFFPGEGTCYAKYAMGIKILPVSEPPNWVQFFSINPLNLTGDEEGKAQKGLGRRADCNVTSHRNILVEFDKVGLDEQLRYVIEIGMPWSTCVYSGGKSYHFVIALKASLPSRAAYDCLVARIYHAVGTDKVDKSCRNPSRLSRFPGVIRVGSGQEQRLIDVRGKVCHQELATWLNGFSPADPDQPRRSFNVPSAPLFAGQKGRLSQATIDLLRVGTEEGERNVKLYKAACDFHRQEFTFDHARGFLLSFLEHHPDFPHTEFERTVRSAFSGQPLYPPRRDSK